MLKSKEKKVKIRNHRQTHIEWRTSQLIYISFRLWLLRDVTQDEREWSEWKNLIIEGIKSTKSRNWNLRATPIFLSRWLMVQRYSKSRGQWLDLAVLSWYSTEKRLTVFRRFSCFRLFARDHQNAFVYMCLLLLGRTFTIICSTSERGFLSSPENEKTHEKGTTNWMQNEMRFIMLRIYNYFNSEVPFDEAAAEKVHR